jgi:hypothetical protein
MLSPESSANESLPTPDVFEFDHEGDTAHMEAALELLSDLQTAEAVLDELEGQFNQMGVDEQTNIDVVTTLAAAQMKVKELQDKIAALKVSPEALAAQYGENPNPNDIPDLENLADTYKIN